MVVINVFVTTVNTAEVPLNVTLVAPGQISPQDVHGRPHHPGGGLCFHKRLQANG